MILQTNGISYLPKYSKKWPILNHPMGWLLIVQDFQHLELSTAEDAINQWPQFFLNVKKICPLQKKKKDSSSA